jgi:hypothetical protein
MTLAKQASMRGQDGRVTDEQPGRPKRRTFTKAYKARIPAQRRARSASENAAQIGAAAAALAVPLGDQSGENVLENRPGDDGVDMPIGINFLAIDV